MLKLLKWIYNLGYDKGYKDGLKQATRDWLLGEAEQAMKDKL